MGDDTLLEELLDQWESAADRGEQISPEALCREHPDMLEVLREKIDALQTMQVRLGTQVLRSDATLPDDDRPLPDPTVSVATQYHNLVRHKGGGLGVVYRARDSRMHRDVAVKFIRQPYAADRASRARFQIEAEVTSRLDHPGIIPVHGMGETSDRRLFYVMRFVEGRTLEEAIGEYHQEKARLGVRDRNLRSRALLQNFASVCRTLAYAHNRGIVHRDIKPANILLGRFGETLIGDWGLALPVGREERFRVQGEETLIPRNGGGKSSESGGGTPPYMSPEQHRWLPDIRPSSDIYSLGATLLKLLTNQHGCEGCRTLSEIRRRVCSGRIPGPRELDPAIPKPLDAICRRAMAVNPEDRYETAMQLADDIDNYLADERVTAHREGRSEKCFRWVRRHKTSAKMVLAGLLAVAAVSMVSSLWLARMADREKQARREAELRTGDVARSNALLAARTMAHDINLRMIVLREDAQDQRLQQLMAEYVDSDSEERRAEIQEELQYWLLDRSQRRNLLAGDDEEWAPHWLLYDQKGTQLARVPNKETDGRPVSSINGNFAYRSYFSGGDRDLQPGEAVAPHSYAAHLSAVYQSVVDKKYCVGFSVPIRRPAPQGSQRGDNTVIGILGLTIFLGEVSAVKAPHVMLADLRTDYLEDGKPRQGLIMHHPDLEKLLDKRPGSRETSDLPRLSPELVERMQKVREEKVDGGISNNNLIHDFVDPLDPKGQPGSIAAFEPVIVEGDWPRHVRNTGLVVLVQIPDHAP